MENKKRFLSFMNKIIVKLSLLVIILIVMFYWYEWRPHNIRISCMSKITNLMTTTSSVGGTMGDYKLAYELCLHQKGILR